MDTEIKSKKLSLSTLSFYILIIIVIVMTGNLVSQRYDKAYNIIKFRSYTVLSGSMEPTFYAGDLVIVAKVNTKNLEVGDIVTFYKDNDIITHRIEQFNELGYITKGDNNNTIDSETVLPNDIIGKVIFSIPKAGYVIQFLSKSWVVAIELILLGVLIIFSNKEK